jgi:hypothetical protein
MNRLLALLLSIFAFALAKQEIIAYYNPSCGCCSSYFSKLEKEGFRIKKVKVSNEELDRIKNNSRCP